jgi:O-succinylbenzoate synthase
MNAGAAQVELRHVRMRLRSDFRTSFGLERDRDCIVIRIQLGGFEGWGECVAGAEPGYSYETAGTAWHVLSDYFIPALFRHNDFSAKSLQSALDSYRGHPLARAGLEMALLDLEGKRTGHSFSSLLGGKKRSVPVGVSIGIQETPEATLYEIQNYLEQGYRRIKVKIAPGSDIEVLEAIRKDYPDLSLWVDANAAYSMDDIELFDAMDDLELGLIEQPLFEDDLLEHAKLQKRLATPICLDESIHHLRDARHAVELGSCRVINIKPARVGGYLMACQIDAYCSANQLSVWCGGMLETGIGRAANLALASRSGFDLPGDISATARYYEKDISEPEFLLNEDSSIDVPDAPGLGVEVDMDFLESVTLNKAALHPD